MRLAVSVCLLLLAAQVAALDHVHLDAASVHDCVHCAHLGSEPVAPASMPTLDASGLRGVAPRTPEVIGAPVRSVLAPSARAPPLAAANR